MFLLRIILFPFAVLFDLITRTRNHLYSIGAKPSVSFEVPVIGVGNLAVGGTGKTPMVEYLFRLLKNDKVALLSRGYGRKTRGIRIASEKDNAATLGDEPFQFYQKFKDAVVAVGEERVLAIPVIKQQFPEVTVVLLDDAFQHRRIRPAFTILLTDYNHPFYRDFLLPAGRLREARRGASRADVIVVTKCDPGISEDEMMVITNRINEYAEKPVFFTRIRYGSPISFGGHARALKENILLMTGIANADPLKKYVETHFNLIQHIAYRDHHRYSEKDILYVQSLVKEDIAILTTEKDMVKINDDRFKHLLSSLPLFYLPIQVDFIKNGVEFDALVQNAVHNGG